jgi:hypothetical protein
MAFNTNSPQAQYIVQTGQTVFTFDFKIYVDTDLIVTRGNLLNEFNIVNPNEYTVVINGDLGGSITFSVEQPENYKMYLTRELPVDRSIEYQKNGDLHAATLNDDQDYQTYLIADNTFKNDDFYRNPTGYEFVSTTMPAPEANRTLVWNSNADALINTELIVTDATFIRINDLATEGQLVIDVSPYTPQAAQVYINGSLQTNPSDYSIFGSSVTLITPMEANDEFTVIVGGDIPTEPEALFERLDGTVISDTLTIDVSPYTPDSIQLYINGTLQTIEKDYSILGSIITLVNTLEIDDDYTVIVGTSMVVSETPTVAYIETIAELATIDPLFKTVIVREKENGGIFNYDATAGADDGANIFSKWVREVSFSEVRLSYKLSDASNNNTFFVDSADNLLKFKDNAGIVKVVNLT